MARRGAQVADRPPLQRSMAAAATRIRLDDTRVAQRQAAKRQEWQTEGWAYYDADQPEVKHGVLFTGNGMSKLRIYAAVRPAGAPVESDPIPIDADGSDVPPELQAAAKAELDRLRGPLGGIQEIQRLLNINLEVAGDCWLIGRGERPDTMNLEGKRVPGSREAWDVRSISEVDVREGVYYVKAHRNDPQGEPLDPELDTAIRVYQRHPQWASEADNNLKGVLIECRILQVLASRVLAEALSGLPAEMLLMPNELSFGPANVTDGEGGDEAATDPFVEELDAQIGGAIEDPSGSMATVRPLLVRGPAEYLGPDYVRTVSFKRETPELEARIEQHVQRLARGWNLPVETVMGHQATTYANAEQVDEDTFEDYLQPRAVLLVDALTVAFLRPNMMDAYPGSADVIDRICLWYDTSALVAQPDRQTNAIPAHEHNLISDASARQALGFNEDDAPEAIELIVRAGLRRGILTAELTAALLQELADEAGVELPSPDELAPGAGGQGGGGNGAMRALAQLLLMAEARKAEGQASSNGNGRHRPPVALEGPPPFDLPSW